MFNIFGAKPAAPVSTNPNPALASGVQQPTAKLQNNQPNIEPVQTPGTDANGVVPNNPQTEVSPLDEFKDLWHTDPDKQVNNGFVPEPLDAAKLHEVISKTNMTAVITPEIQARINAGGEDAVIATQEAMNLVAQQTLMQSTTVANKMFEAQSSKLVESVLAQIPGLVKQQSVNSALTEANPLYSDPAIAPVIEAVKSRLQLKNPDATAAELTDMAQNFVKVMSEQFNPNKPDPSPLDGEIDWSDFEKQ